MSPLSKKVDEALALYRQWKKLDNKYIALARVAGSSMPKHKEPAWESRVSNAYSASLHAKIELDKVKGKLKKADQELLESEIKERF